MADVISNVHTWDFSKLVMPVPYSIKEIIRAILPQHATSQDRLVWGPSSLGKYSPKSGYDWLVKGSSPSRNISVMWIWKLQVAEKVKHFICLISFDRIACNDLRARCVIAVSNLCLLCDLHAETSLHLVRECYMAKDIWFALLPSSISQEFFQLPLHSWLDSYVHKSHHAQDIAVISNGSCRGKLDTFKAAFNM